MQVAALYVVQDDERRALVFLRERGKGLAQFLECLLGHFASRTFRIEVLDELLEFRVDVVCIDGSRTRLRNIGVNGVFPCFLWVATFATSFKEFTIALQQNLISLLVQFHLHLCIGVAVLEFIFALFPYEALQLGSLQQMGHLAEAFGKHIPVFTAVGQLFEVHDLVRMEDVADGEEALVDVGKILLQLIHKHA